MCPYILFFEVWKYYFRNSRSVSNCTQYSVTLFQNLIKGQQGQRDSIRTAQKRTRQPLAWELVFFFLLPWFYISHFHFLEVWKSRFSNCTKYSASHCSQILPRNCYLLERFAENYPFWQNLCSLRISQLFKTWFHPFMTFLTRVYFEPRLVLKENFLQCAGLW